MTETAVKPEARESRESQSDKAGAEETGRNLLQGLNMSDFKSASPAAKEISKQALDKMGLPNSDQLLKNFEPPAHHVGTYLQAQPGPDQYRRGGTFDGNIKDKPTDPGYGGKLKDGSGGIPGDAVGNKDKEVPDDTRGGYADDGAVSRGQKLQMQKQIVEGMGRTDQEIFRRQNNAMRDYEDEAFHGLLAGKGLNASKPMVSLYNRVQEKIKERTDEYKRKAQDEFGPEGKLELRKQMREHDRSMASHFKGVNEKRISGNDPLPEPPPMVKEYYAKVKRLINTRGN